MTNVDTNDDSEERSRPRAGHPHDLDLPRYLSRNGGEIEDGIAALVATERPTVSVAKEAAVAAHVENMLADLAKLIKVPTDIPPIGADAALKVLKCFEIVAKDIRAIAADRVQAALELQAETESYATVMVEAGKVLATRVSAESARAYKLSLILREAREIIAGPMPGETTQ